MPDANSFRALRDARPSALTDDEAARAQRDRIIATDPSAASAAPVRPFAVRPRIVQLVIGGLAAAALVAAAFAFAPPTKQGTTALVPGVTSAYAAIQQAVAKTAASSESGTIVTRTNARWIDGSAPQIAMGTTIRWNGADVAYDSGLAPNRGISSLYVNGEYYESEGEKWVHYPGGNGRQGAGGRAASWVMSARRDVSGKRIAKVVDVLKDLVSQPQGDGSTVYIGHATAGAIDAQYKDTDGLPYTSRPFPKIRDSKTTVKVAITVGADGIIRTWTAAYSADKADWVYTAEYKNLGSTPAITAPKPAEIIEGHDVRG